MAYANVSAGNISGSNATYTVKIPLKGASAGATNTHYAGTLVLSSGGYALVATTVPTTNHKFLGVAMETVSNNSTTDGVGVISVAPKGRFVLTTASAAASHVNTVCGWNTGSSGAPNLVVVDQTTFAVGTIIEVISSTKVLVDIDAKAMTGSAMASS